MEKQKYTFIDLFAGLGGFHLALEQLGCQCVFASELKSDLQQLYKNNFPTTPVYGDITKHLNDIPPHDILCGGFPCQPFSQAGKRQGFNDEKDRGNLFYYICQIIEQHKPKYILLENVSNLRGHDGGNTWSVISSELDRQGYYVKDSILSPHEFGIPQHRKRIYIACKRKDLGSFDYFDFPTCDKKMKCDIKTILNENETNVISLKEETIHQLKIWQEFIDETISHNEKIPSFPIWAMEFGATYPYEDVCPAYQPLNKLQGRRGKLGKIITGETQAECLSQLPIYAQTAKDKEFPGWKKRYIQQNRDFYSRNKQWLDKWLKHVQHFENSHLKMEWNCGLKATPTINDKIVQFRASGIRIKLPTFAPALNLVGTQIPIFPWIKVPGTEYTGRYMTLAEAAALQGMQNLKFEYEDFKLSLGRCYEALGNAVNVEVVYQIAKNLIQYGK